MLRIFFRDVASWRQVYLAAKPSHVGVDVDRLAYSLQRPTACNHSDEGKRLPIMCQFALLEK
jgi:hypothetical protein